MTIIEWGDYECPFSRRAQATLEALRRVYGDELRVAFKHHPLEIHERALPAALAAAAAARQGKFWAMHALLFANQGNLGDGTLLALARVLGLDVRAFERDMRDPALAQQIDAHTAEAISLRARGTPAFFVNGQYLSGAQPLDGFRRLIDTDRQEATRLLAAGVNRDELNETLRVGAQCPCATACAAALRAHENLAPASDGSAGGTLAITSGVDPLRLRYSSADFRSEQRLGTP